MNISTKLRYLLSVALIWSYITGAFGSEDDTLPETCGSVDPSENSTIPTRPRAHSPPPLNRTKPRMPNPFPFLSLGANRTVILEAITIPRMNQFARDPASKHLGSNMRCHQTHHFVSKGIGGSIALEFRSQGYPSDAPDNTTSVTCFESPAGWTISLSCEEFAVTCGKSYVGISLDGNLSPIKTYCGDALNISMDAAWSNKLSVAFVTGGGGHEVGGNSSASTSSKRFKCRIHVAQPKENLISSTPPGIADACKCGKRNTQLTGRIIGGTAAKPNEFPWRCLIMVHDPYDYEHVPKQIIGICGCSLISNKWVLTAAHCITSFWDGIKDETAYIVFGGHVLNSTSDHMVTVTSRKFIMHPAYNDRNLSNDIALMELDEPILYNNKISPICLLWKWSTDDFKGCTIVTSGWGYTSKSSTDLSPILNKVNLKILAHQKCETEYWAGDLEDTTICAYEPGKAIWRGDSGGSIDLRRNGSYYAIGVSSFAHKYKVDYPSVFTRVTSFLGWIKSTTDDNFCGE